MTDGRIILDTDFSALPDAAFWPHPDYKVVTAAYGATSTVTGGWGRLDTGNNGNWGGGITLQVRSQVTDAFEAFLRIKAVTPASGGTVWAQYNYRSTNDWNYTTGVNSGDVFGDPSYYFGLSIANTNGQFVKRVSYSSSQFPNFYNNPGWAANAIVRARIRVIGDTQMARVWLESTPEPNVWHSGRLIDQSVPRRGWLSVGLGSFNAHGIMDFSRITVREIANVWEPILANFATATFSGTGAQTAFTVTHGIDGTPSNIVLTPRSAAASAAYYVSAVTGTTFTVTYMAAPASGTGNVVFDWRAEV